MNIKSGIILAGGTGSRLFPLNNLFNKHMIPVYNKFIIDYPLNTLKNIGVTHVTVVLGGLHFSQVVSHVADGSKFDMQVNYVYQDKPSGIAQAINLCKKFVINEEHFVTILGDNIFEEPILINKGCDKGGQVVLASHEELSRFGVATLNDDKIVRIEEKPRQLDSKHPQYAISGCYFFNEKFFQYFTDLKPSARGEYEITDIIRKYNENDDLGFSYANGMWSDAGTHESINFVNNYFYKKNHS